MIVASIDIGSNTVLILIANTKNYPGQIEVLADEYRIPRISRNLKPGDAFPQENINALYKVLGEYKSIMEKYRCEYVLTSATNAFRIASGTEKIIKEVKGKFGIEINIISGKEEAELTYLGASASYDSGKENMLIDIGGGSTEITIGKGAAILYSESFPVGVVSFSEKYQKEKYPNIEELFAGIASAVKKFSVYNRTPGKTIAVAGTPTTLACIHKGISIFDEKEVEGTILTDGNIRDMIKKFGTISPEEILRRYTPVVKGREDLILTGACILLYIMELYSVKEILVSTKGIRYGLLYKHLSANSEYSAG